MPTKKAPVVEDDLMDEVAEDTETVEDTQGEEPEVEDKPKAEPARFCKGQMPMALVWFIKFSEDKENKTAIAKKYFTTSGKITDIQSGSNQKYIVENMCWSGEELTAAAETVKANFVRGQDNELLMAHPEANKRKLATSTAEDAEYSLSVINKIAEMEFAEDAVTLAEARATYNAANPRKSAESKTGETTEDQTEEEVTEDDSDAVDDLLE